jgi:hypothetical protein
LEICSSTLSIDKKEPFRVTYGAKICTVEGEEKCTTHTECKNYDVTRCGDKIQQSQEMCDDGDGVNGTKSPSNTHMSPNGDRWYCDESCKMIVIPPEVCPDDYPKIELSPCIGTNICVDK